MQQILQEAQSNPAALMEHRALLNSIGGFDGTQADIFVHSQECRFQKEDREAAGVGYSQDGLSFLSASKQQQQPLAFSLMSNVVLSLLGRHHF